MSTSVLWVLGYKRENNTTKGDIGYLGFWDIREGVTLRRVTLWRLGCNHLRPIYLEEEGSVGHNVSLCMRASLSPRLPARFRKHCQIPVRSDPLQFTRFLILGASLDLHFSNLTFPSSPCELTFTLFSFQNFYLSLPTQTRSVKPVGAIS